MYEPTVGVYVGNNVDKVQLLRSQELFRIIVNRRHAESLRELLRFCERAIVNRGALVSRQFTPGGQLIIRPETRAENRETQLFHLRNRCTFSRVTMYVPVLKLTGIGVTPAILSSDVKRNLECRNSKKAFTPM